MTRRRLGRERHFLAAGIGACGGADPAGGAHRGHLLADRRVGELYRSGQLGDGHRAAGVQPEQLHHQARFEPARSVPRRKPGRCQRPSPPAAAATAASGCARLGSAKLAVPVWSPWSVCVAVVCCFGVVCCVGVIPRVRVRVAWLGRPRTCSGCLVAWLDWLRWHAPNNCNSTYISAVTMTVPVQTPSAQPGARQPCSSTGAVTPGPGAQHEDR